jgi:hypothetical protein
MWFLQKAKTWIWPSARFILVTAALREVLKLLGVDLGKMWSTIITTATDYQNTYGLVTLMVLGLILTFILEMYWPLIRGRIEGMFSNGIPIAISDVRLPVFSNYTGFFKDPDPDDNLAWHSDIIDIANVSETKSVSLKIFLRIKSKTSNLNIRLLADGMGGPANQYRWDEHQITEVKRESEGNQQRTSYKAVSTGRPPPNIIRCPLKLGH